MTTDDLAQDYYKRSIMRAKALKVLLDEGAFPDVVRESQEIVELLLKGFLRKKLPTRFKKGNYGIGFIQEIPKEGPLFLFDFLKNRNITSVRGAFRTNTF